MATIHPNTKMYVCWDDNGNFLSAHRVELGVDVQIPEPPTGGPTRDCNKEHRDAGFLIKSGPESPPICYYVNGKLY